MKAWSTPAICWAATKSLVDNPHSILYTILGADCLPQFSGAFAYRLICDRETYRVGQSLGSQTFARDWGWTSAQSLDPPPPKRLIICNGDDNARYARPQPCSRRARAAVMRYRGHAGEEPVVGNSLGHKYLVGHA